MITLPLSKQVLAMTIELADKFVTVRMTLANSPQTSRELLLLLSNDDEPYVRWFVARNGATPQNALEKLTHDEDPVISRTAIENPNLDLDYIKALSTGCGSIVKIAEREVARRKSLRSKIHQMSKLVKKFKTTNRKMGVKT